MGRINRTQLPPDALRTLYVEAELPAGEVSGILLTSRGTVLRNAHEIRLPVRIGGPPPVQGPSEIELIDALYRLLRQRLLFEPGDQVRDQTAASTNTSAPKPSSPPAPTPREAELSLSHVGCRPARIAVPEKVSQFGLQRK